MGIFDIMQQPGEELSPQELQRKADKFDGGEVYSEMLNGAHQDNNNNNNNSQ